MQKLQHKTTLTQMHMEAHGWPYPGGSKYLTIERNEGLKTVSFTVWLLGPNSLISKYPDPLGYIDDSSRKKGPSPNHQ